MILPESRTMKPYWNYLVVPLFCLLLPIQAVLTGCGSGSKSELKDAFILDQTLTSQEGGFSQSLALDGAGNVYANSLFNGEVGSYRSGITRYARQSSGQYVAARLAEETGRGTGPMAVSPVSGRLFVWTSVSHGQIEVYDSNGQRLRSHPFPLPVHDIRASNRGDVFILKSLSPSPEQIIRLDEDGNQTGNFSLGRTFFIGAVRLATDNDGNLAVLGGEDTNHVPTPPTVRVYSPQGTLLRETPLAPQTFPNGVPVNGLAIGVDGKLYLTEGGGPNRLRIFDYQTGQLLVTQTIKPFTGDIAVDRNGMVYILGVGNVFLYRPNP
jgi:hypothetical protein